MRARIGERGCVARNAVAASLAEGPRPEEQRATTRAPSRSSTRTPCGKRRWCSAASRSAPPESPERSAASMAPTRAASSPSLAAGAEGGAAATGPGARCADALVRSGAGDSGTCARAGTGTGTASRSSAPTAPAASVASIASTDPAASLVDGTIALAAEGVRDGATTTRAAASGAGGAGRGASTRGTATMPAPARTIGTAIFAIKARESPFVATLAPAPAIPAAPAPAAPPPANPCACARCACARCAFGLRSSARDRGADGSGGDLRADPPAHALAVAGGRREPAPGGTEQIFRLMAPIAHGSLLSVLATRAR